MNRVAHPVRRRDAPGAIRRVPPSSTAVHAEEPDIAFPGDPRIAS